MSDTTIHLTPSAYSYLQTNSLRIPEVLKQLQRETIEKKFNSHMQISPEQGQFMHLLIRLLNAKKTLDIGTFTGYSALTVALALPDDGKVITCDICAESSNFAEIFWQIAKVRHKIDLRIAPALEILNNLLNNNETNTFDFIFIDADKQNQLTYYEKSLALLRPGGLIAIDNVLWYGKVADTAAQDSVTIAIRELNKKILNDDRVTISMLPIGDGLTLAYKN